MRRYLWILLPLLIAGLFLSCGESNDPAEDADTVTDEATVADADTAELPDELVGRFVVSLIAPVEATDDTAAKPGSTSILGKVQDGPALSLVVWEQAAAVGDCILWSPRIPFCNEPCGATAACVEDDTCKDYPLAHGAGIITVTGLGDAAFTIEPVANNYMKTGLPYPAFSEGGTVTFAVPGGEVAAFTLTAKGIAPLELLSESLPLAKDTALALQWTAPGQNGLSTIYIKLDIAHHGGSSSKIECSVDDNGSFSIPATLVTSLMDLGVAGFPTVKLARNGIGAAATNYGWVELQLTSEVEKEVLIDGLISCNSTDDCPDGQTCQDDLTCK